MNASRLPRLSHLVTYQPSRLLTCRASSTTSNPGANTSAARDTQTLTLPDGRTLCYADYGPATGFPILYFHGYPSSRLEAGPIADIAAKKNLRVVAPDRPGFGGSTFQPGRQITWWPNDVNCLASHLGLKRFAILGGSGGGPYALACALDLPREQMSGVGLLAGAPPWDAGTKDVMWLSWLTAGAARNTPGVLRVAADALVASMRWAVNTDWVKGRIDGWLESEVEKEKKRKAGKSATAEDSVSESLEEEDEEPNVNTAERREQLLRLLFEAFAQGSEASVQEALLLTQNWGFRFEDVEYDRIQIWHGTRDVNAPISMIRWMAARLPHCELNEFDDTHFTLIHQLENILAQLVPEETRK